MSEITHLITGKPPVAHPFTQGPGHPRRKCDHSCFGELVGRGCQISLAAHGRKDQRSRTREEPRHLSVRQANLTEEELETLMSQILD